MRDARDCAGEDRPTVGQRHGPGILVFSSSLKLLYENRRAEELTALLTTQDAGFSSIMPAAVHRVCHSILESLSRCQPAQAWGQVNERQSVSEPVRSLLIRGFGLRRETHTESARIVILLEER